MNPTSMTRRAGILLWVLCSALPVMGAEAVRPALSLEEFRSTVVNTLSQPRFQHAAIGIHIVSLETGAELFSTNAHKLLKPASNNKLFSGALALDRLGPNFRIHTSLLSARKPSRSGTLDGDLIVFGRGDFSMAARFHEGDYGHILDPLVEAFLKAGIRRIRGSLVGDESYFHAAPFGSNWAWDDLQYYYGAEASALTVQDNVVDLTFSPGAKVGAPCGVAMLPALPFLIFSNRTTTASTGTRAGIEISRLPGSPVVILSDGLPLGSKSVSDAVAVNDAPGFFLAMFRAELAKRGISVSGKNKVHRWNDPQAESSLQPGMNELGYVESPPVSLLVERMMKPSQNLYAHLLLLQVGRQREARLATNQVAAAARPDTEAMGLAELADFLKEAGVDTQEVLLEEGSGLSRGALVTPAAIVGLLRHMAHHKSASVFENSLPIAGRDGTLKNRFKGSTAEGVVHAKTGSLRYVSSLSGYTTTQAGEQVAFSIMVNNYKSPETAHPATLDMDQIVIALVNLASKTSGTR